MQLELKLLKKTESEFHAWFEGIKVFAESITIPRIASRLGHRANVPADSLQKHHAAILESHNHRNGHQIWINSPDKDKIAQSRYIHCCILCLLKSDLPYPQLLPTEFNGWRIKCTSLSPDDRPDTTGCFTAL